MTIGRYRLDPQELPVVLKKLRNLSLAIAATALIAALFQWFVLARGRDWRHIPLIVDFGILFLAAILLALRAWRGRYQGVWSFTIVGLIVFGVTSFLISDLGIWYGLCAILFPLAIAAQLPAGKTPRWVIASGIATGILVLFFDLYWPLDRPTLVQDILILYDVPPLLFLITLAAAAFRDFRSRPLRIKLTVAFVIVGLGSVLPAILYLNISSRNIIRTRQYEKLEAVAAQTALELDNFIETTRKMVENEAQLISFRQYLEIPPEYRVGSVQAQAVFENLRSLARKDMQYVLAYDLIDPQGRILMSSTNTLGANQMGEDYFQQTLKGTAVASDVTWEGNKPVIYFAAPIYSDTSVLLGILRLTYKAEILQDIVSGNNNLAGIGSYGLIFNDYHLRLANGHDPSQLYQFAVPPLFYDRVSFLRLRHRLPEVPDEQLSTNFPELEAYLNTVASQPYATLRLEEKDYAGLDVSLEYVAAKKMTTQPWWVLFAQDEVYALAPLKGQKLTIVWLLLGISALGGVVTFGAMLLITRPVNRLTLAATRLGQGDLTVQLPVESEDEFGLLSKTFNQMAQQIHQSITGLEERVAERTRDIERRAAQIQLALEASKAISSVRALDQLLPHVAQLVSERFGFYHVGIFLLDERGENAELRAASSVGGQRMLARRHSLKVGGTGIVGYVTATGTPRIAMNVGQDSVFYNNPDLPETRSEMALPLMVAGKVLGALDIQSVEENAFTESDVAILQVVADQIAAAIENARLFADLQNALEATQRAYGEVSQRAWTDYLRARPDKGYLVNLSDRPIPIARKFSADLEAALADLAAGKMVQLSPHLIFMPIKVRGLVAGVIRLEKSDLERAWSVEEVNLVEALTEQLSMALENARLYHETQRNAARDRLVSEITDKMRRAMDMDTLLKTTVHEIANALGVSEAFIQFTPEIAPVEHIPGGNGDQP